MIGDVEDKSGALRSGLFASPVLLATVGALGTGVGAMWQGYWNAQVEQQRFQTRLVEKALEAPDREEARRRLKFLADTGLVNTLNVSKLATLQIEDVPVFFGAAIRDGLISVRNAKLILQKLGNYTGPIDDKPDHALLLAVAAFQRDQQLPADGYIGPITLQKLQQLAPDFFKSPEKPKGQEENVSK